MAGIAFGFTPLEIGITLSPDADFYTSLVNADGWEDGVGIELRFPIPGADSASWVVWPATISGTTAAWDVVKTSVNTVVTQAKGIGGSGRARVRLHYIDTSGNDLLWGEGPINIA